MPLISMRKIWVLLVVLIFAIAGVTPALCGSRIIPTGTVEVFEGETLVQVLKKESSLPNGGMLATKGKCGVRMENIYLVAEDGTMFGVADGADRVDLRVDKGMVYFSINEETDKLAFLTPAGVISTQQVQLNASAADNRLKGFLDVKGSQVHFGVLEGGSMVVSTAQGEEKVVSGKQIVLAISDPAEKADTKEVKKPVAKKNAEKTFKSYYNDTIPAAYFVGGGVGLAGAGTWAVTDRNRSRGRAGRPTAASPVRP